ncbi:TPA: hypothetical protein ACH3X2_008986 [Trebouxia sp. C0005]
MWISVYTIYLTIGPHRAMYKRDFAILLLSAFAIYFSVQHEGPVSFRQAWYHHLDDESLLEAHDVLCPPVVADLNGDGTDEVLVSTHGTTIQALSPGRGEQIKGDFAAAAKIGEVHLEANSTVKLAGMHIVALAAGYIDAPPAELVIAPRKQVLVAVTSNWQVLCLDHNLKLRWETTILGGAHHKHARVREVAIHISNYTMRREDRGSVVVGGSIEMGDLTEEDPFSDELDIEQELARLLHSGKKEDELQDLDRETDTKGVDISRHFSMYAFDGGTGNLRWKHEGEDFHKDAAELQDRTVPQHNHRLDAEHLGGRHYGEASCRDFRESVLAAMPHSWERRHDTSLEPAHFFRHRSSTGAKKQYLSSPGPMPRALPQQAGLSRPKEGAEHHRGIDKGNPVTAALGKATAVMAGTQTDYFDAEPNVFVAHLRDGLEVVSLHTGRTICKLHLASPGLHLDLNGDGVLDHIQAAGGKETDALYSRTGHQHHHRCWGTVTSGVPPNTPLFNGSICRYSAIVGLPFGGSNMGGSVPPLEVATPAVLPQPPQRSDMGHHEAGNLAVFLNSRGEVTAYSATGRKLWQNAHGLTWSNHHRQSQGQQVTPTLRALQLRADGNGPHVLMAAGSHTAIILSPQGHTLDLLTLPAAPAIPLQVVDFDGDGNNDLILLSRDGVYAFVQVRHIGGLPFTTLIGILLIAMAAVYFTQVQPQARRQGGKKGRSTDRVD